MLVRVQHAMHACEFTGSSFKFHIIFVSDRLAHGAIRALHWVDTRDMLADGLIKGGIDRALLHRASSGFRYNAIHEPLTHRKHKNDSITNSVSVTYVGAQKHSCGHEGLGGWWNQAGSATVKEL